jgi:regulator of sigma E protease
MNTDFLAALTLVAVFAGVVLIHELGHFVVGKLMGIEVEEFGIGLPPRILTLFRWQGTEFTLNWIPLGGFNRFKGEDDPDTPGGFSEANPWARLAVLFAGPVMNLLAGVFIYSLIFTQIGLPDFSHVRVYEVSPDSPAEKGGLQKGDIILRAGGEEITGDKHLRDMIHAYLDTPMPLTVLRGGEEVSLTVTPLSSRTVEEGAIGISPGPVLVPPSSWAATLPYSALTTYDQAKQILLLPARLLRGTLSSEEGRFIGFKGIYDVFRQTLDRDAESREQILSSQPENNAELPTFYTLNLIASLTITLGVFNLLPFPALDGGRILFTLPEIFIRRRIPPKFQNAINAIGLLILIAFMVYVNLMDFIKPVHISIP